ncbi:WD40 repeat-like protein [Ascodesmis nigricans]|uniref:WD40 repeat-like protein n=1 Tax=Ascodesmis nigricans TaxID=341454 RepID=A0A4S2N2M4_9PEZI|nr:WD40 repeat-like protein [Ascodesmis nigricans]
MEFAIDGAREDTPGSPIASIPPNTSETVRQDIGPFLRNHIPQQYSSQNTAEPDTRNVQLKPPPTNTRYCYRHRPDLKCRRQANEPTMEQLQRGMEKLPAADQQAISHVWNLFSAAPAQMRKLMLQGILQQCCFPQLSYLSGAVRDLIRIDFLSTLPPEISFKILSYLDTASLCRAAQVSHNWRVLADDDVVWHKMCEQHIDRKCDKCGWGLPLLERKRLRASRRTMELRAQQPQSAFTQQITAGTSRLNINGKRPESSEPTPDPATVVKRPCQREGEVTPFRPQPWKTVFSERYKVEANWRRGRCIKREFKGHTDGILCLQFDEQTLATGSYDSTIKIWDIETGEVLQTLTGHTQAIRCLQFDDTKLISGSMDHKMKIWNYRTGQCISTLAGHEDGVVSLHFDSTLLVSASVDNTIKVWNFTEKNTFTLKGHHDWVNSVRIDSGSRTVFSASDDQTIKMWDLDARCCVRTFEGHVGHVQQVIPITLHHRESSPAPPGPPSRSSPTPSHLTSPPTSFRATSPTTPLLKPTPNRSPPPSTLISAALDGTIKFWDVATGKCTRTLFGHVEGIWALAADSLRVISGAQDSMVKVWDLKSGTCQRTLTNNRGPVTCVGLGDSAMVTAGEDRVVRLYRFKDLEGEGEVVGRAGDGVVGQGEEVVE